MDPPLNDEIKIQMKYFRLNDFEVLPLILCHHCRSGYQMPISSKSGIFPFELNNAIKP